MTLRADSDVDPRQDETVVGLVGLLSYFAASDDMAVEFVSRDERRSQTGCLGHFSDAENREHFEVHYATVSRAIRRAKN